MAEKMNTCGLAIFLLVVFTERLSAYNQCSYYGHTNGCSIPRDWPYFYKDVFKPGCDKHDICYACGQKYGLSRSTCDRQFWQDLKAICRSDPSVDVEPWCQAVTFDYYAAVRLAGSSHYESSSPSWCSQGWVSNCLNVLPIGRWG